MQVKIKPIPVMTRVPPELHEWLKEAAANDERSLNWMIVNSIRNERKRRGEQREAA